MDEDSFLVSPFPNIKTHDVAYMIINREDISVAYTYLTGMFPFKSSHGTEYIIVAYHYDDNFITAEELKIEKQSPSPKPGRKFMKSSHKWG